MWALSSFIQSGVSGTLKSLTGCDSDDARKGPKVMSRDLEMSRISASKKFPKKQWNEMSSCWKVRNSRPLEMSPDITHKSTLRLCRAPLCARVKKVKPLTFPASPTIRKNPFQRKVEPVICEKDSRNLNGAEKILRSFFFSIAVCLQSEIAFIKVLKIPIKVARKIFFVAPREGKRKREH